MTRPTGRPPASVPEKAKHAGDAAPVGSGQNLPLGQTACWRKQGPLQKPMYWPASPLAGQPPTGEPYAGDPHVRFGGRGDRDSPVLPTPIQRPAPAVADA